VFLPSGTIALSVPPRVARGRDLPRQLLQSKGFDLRYLSTDGLGLIYTVYISDDPVDRAIDPLPQERRDDYIAVPPGHERVAELAREVVGDATTDREKADRIVRFLSQGEYAYSLDQPRIGEGRQPLEVFLLEAKRGHCEYFSSAMAIML